MTAKGERESVFPIIVVKVNGVQCRALVDTGAGSSYASSTIINLIKVKPHSVTTRNIDMLLTTKQVRARKYKVTIAGMDSDYEMPVELTEVDKNELLRIDNPHYDALIARYPYLKPVKLNDPAGKPTLPVHLVLGAGEYARIKTNAQPLLGSEGEPVAEKTKLGWFIMSPGIEVKAPTLMFAQPIQADYDHLCRLDVLGLADCSEGDQEDVYCEFKEQLERDPSGWYQTSLPWRGNHLPLATNEAGSKRRLRNLDCCRLQI